MGVYMKKLLKFVKMLFSRYILIFILLVIQIGFLWLVLDILETEYFWIRLIFWAIEIIIFFHLMNKKEAPEFKIPWIVIFLLIPLTGIIAYIFFKNHGIRKRHNKILINLKNDISKYFLPDDDVINFENENSAGGAFKYLAKQNSLRCYSHSKVTYFEVGEKYFEDIIKTLKMAKEFIFIEFFIISRGKLWNEVLEILEEKAAEGVDIKILFDDIGSAGNMNHMYLQKLRKKGIEVVAFNKVVPILSGIYNNRDHRKIVIVDHIAAYTGGNNLADEYANIIQRFGHWKDTGVKIQGRAMNNLIALFLQLYELETKKKYDYDKLFNYEYEIYDDPGYVIPFGDGPKPFFSELIGEGNFLNMINSAKKSVYISSPYLIPTHSLISAIRNAALRGVDVRIMLPGIPDKKLPYKLAKCYFKYLYDAGVKIYLYTPGFNHNKCVLVDEELAFDGTINFDYRSLVHHFECGILMYKTPCIKDILNDFNNTFEKCELVVNPKKKFGIILSIANLFAPLF